MRDTPTMNRGFDRILRIRTDDGHIRTEQNRTPGFQAGLNQRSNRQHARFQMRQLTIEHFDVIQQMAGLNARDDTLRCESRQVFGVDQLAVLDS